MWSREPQPTPAKPVQRWSWFAKNFQRLGASCSEAPFIPCTFQTTLSRQRLFTRRLFETSNVGIRNDCPQSTWIYVVLCYTRTHQEDKTTAALYTNLIVVFKSRRIVPVKIQSYTSRIGSGNIYCRWAKSGTQLWPHALVDVPCAFALFWSPCKSWKWGRR